MKKTFLWTVMLAVSLAGCATTKVAKPTIQDNESLQAPFDVEVKLISGEIIKGALIEVSSEHITVDRGGYRSPFYVPEVRIPCSDIVGICQRGETVFLPPSESPLLPGWVPYSGNQKGTGRPIYRIRKYDNLPFMGLAILGGVFAGDRFSKASSERDLANSLQDLAKSLQQLELDEEADQLYKEADRIEDDAKNHKTQGYIGVVLGLLGLVLACIPSYDEIPLPSISSSTNGSTEISFCFDVSKLVHGKIAGVSNVKTRKMRIIAEEPLIFRMKKMAISTYSPTNVCYSIAHVDNSFLLASEFSEE